MRTQRTIGAKGFYFYKRPLCSLWFSYKSLNLGKILFFLLIGIAFIARFIFIYQKPLGLDEGFNILFSSQSLHSLFHYLKSSNYPPLFFLVFHLWINLFGKGILASRIFILSFNLLTLIPIFYLTKTFKWDKNIFWIFIFGLSPINLFYAQEIRMYSFLAFLSTTTIFLFFKMNKSNKLYIRFFYIFSSILLFYTHYWGIYLIIILFILEFLNNKKMALIDILIILIFSTPNFILFLHQIFVPATQIYIQKHFSHNGLIYILKSTYYLTVGVPQGLKFSPRWIRILLFLFTWISIILSGIYGLLKRDKNILYLIFIVFGVLILPAITSIFIPNYIPFRYPFIIFPIFIILISYGMEVIPQLFLFFLFLFPVLTADYFWTIRIPESSQIVLSVLKQRNEYVVLCGDEWYNYHYLLRKKGIPFPLYTNITGIKKTSEKEFVKDAKFIKEKLNNKRNFLLLEKEDFLAKKYILDSLKQSFTPVHKFKFDNSEIIFWEAIRKQ